MTLGIRKSLEKLSLRYELGKVGAVTLFLGFITAVVAVAHLFLTNSGLTLEPEGGNMYLPWQTPTISLNSTGLVMQIGLNILLGLTIASFGTFVVVNRRQSFVRKFWNLAGAVYLCAGTLVLLSAANCIFIVAGVVNVTQLGSPTTVLGVLVSLSATIATVIAAVFGSVAFSDRWRRSV